MIATTRGALFRGTTKDALGDDVDDNVTPLRTVEWAVDETNYFDNPATDSSLRFTSYAGTNGNVKSDTIVPVEWGVSGLARRTLWTTVGNANNGDVGVILGLVNGATPLGPDEEWTVEYDLEVITAAASRLVTAPAPFASVGSWATIARSVGVNQNLAPGVYHRWITLRGDVTALANTLRVVQTMQGKVAGDGLALGNVMLYPGAYRADAGFVWGDEIDGDLVRYSWLGPASASASVRELGTVLASYGDFPVSIIETSRNVFDEASNTWRTVRYFAGRVSTKIPVVAGDRIRDNRSGEFYVVDEIERTPRGISGRSSVTLTMKRSAS